MRRLALLAAASLLAGCAAAPLPAEHYFRPEVAPAALRTTLARGIVIDLPDAHGVYNDRLMLYRDADGVYQQYNYQVWVEQPMVMLRDELADYLRGAYGADHVYTGDAHALADLVVHADIQHFEQQTGGGKASARLDIDFLLTGRDGVPLAALSFDQTEPAAGTDVADYVQAQSRLLERAYTQLLDKIDPLVRVGR
jgi:ABC-type uncharacterized transport system auxiliary subunit